MNDCIGDAETDTDNNVGERDRGDVTFLSMFAINNRRCGGKLGKSAVLKAIWSGFEETTKPSVCLSTDSTTSKMIKLKSSCGKEFEVSDTVLVKQSQKICRLIETAFTENSIPLVNVNVTAPILEKVFEYCMKHVEAADASKTEMTGKGCIKDDDFAAEKEECASIIGGLKLSTEEKG
ncbi:Vacuolar-sorting receptor 3 [Carex littledalei]|uniref:Vacuolar-sorting receptor 3 n=1 Tax=Carex littledalei TaxID=544730 RepID=A0A833RCL3_9POAL|nr:Vacuolar-sorting receptor 3 [Carex littledalei]